MKNVLALLTPVVALTVSLTTVLLAASPATAAWDDGVAAFHAGRFAAAAAEFRAVVDASPEAPEGHYMLGLSLLRQKQPSSALEPLGRAVELRPGEAAYRLALAQAQLVAGASDDAVATLAAQDPAAVAAELRPTYGQLLARAATAGEPSEAAAAALERATAADPGSKPLWLARAHVARRLDRPAEAFAALAAAFELDSEDHELGRRAVRTAFAVAQDLDGDERRGRYLEGAKIAERLAAASPVPEHLLLAGEARLGAGDCAAARRWFEEAAAVDAADPLPHYYAGRCDLALGEPAAALGRFDAALWRAPGDELGGRIQAARGSALRHLERFGEAAAAYRRAGDEARAAEMDRLAEIHRDNQKWAAEKRRCEEKRRAIERELEEQDFLEGTEAWRRLLRDAERRLADCVPYLPSRPNLNE